MAKANKVEVKQVEVQASDVHFTIGARGAKYTGKEGTKYGTNGTASTWELVKAAVAAHGGSITRSELAAVCVANGDKGYVAYSLRNRWLVPIA